MREHCLNIRGDVDLATEKHIQDIQDQREEIIKKINDYEEKTIQSIQNENVNRANFEKTIKDLDQFAETWKRYLMKIKITSKTEFFGPLLQQRQT